MRACVSVARQTVAQQVRSSRSTPWASSVAACVLKGTGLASPFDLVSHALVSRARRKEPASRFAGMCTVCVRVQPLTVIVRAAAQPSETSPSQPPSWCTMAGCSGWANASADYRDQL